MNQIPIVLAGIALSVVPFTAASAVPDAFSVSTRVKNYPRSGS
jgi:hypothetical protein